MTEKDWQDKEERTNRRIAWNSAINNACILEASGSIQESQFWTKVDELFKAILEGPPEAPQSLLRHVDDVSLLLMCEKIENGIAIPIEEWENFCQNASHAQQTLINNVKKMVKRIESWKLKANGEAKEGYRKTLVIPNQENND